MEATRPVIANGIETLAIRGDLAERCSVVTLDPISDADRETEADFWERFEEARPGILGALLDAAVSGLRNEATIRLPELPRMADYARWNAACELVLPWARGTFLRAFSGNRDAADRTLLEGSLIARSIFEMCRPPWAGTATQLLEAISRKSNPKRPGWPNNARDLSNQLRRIAPAMRRLGAEIEFVRAGHERHRTIRLSMLEPTTPSAPSALSAATGPTASPAVPPAAEIADHADHADEAFRIIRK